MNVLFTLSQPLTHHPDALWLTEPECAALPYVALRTYADACWAWNAFLSQRSQPPETVRYDAIAGMADLFDYALAQRQLALRTGFFSLSREDLDALTALSGLTPERQAIRDSFVAWCDRQEETTDLYDQVLPGSLFDLLTIIEQSPPFGTQGNSGLTKRFRFKKRNYFVKLNDEEISGSPPAGRDERRKVPCYAALRAICPDIVPSAAWHIRAAGGEHAVLTTAVPGHFYHESRVKQAAAAVDSQWLQWIVLVEWLFGISDRHFKNLIIDREHHRAYLIDTARAWMYLRPGFLGWEEDDSLVYCLSFARQLWEIHDPDLRFERAILEIAYDRELAVLAALRPFDLDAAILDELRERFQIVSQALDALTGDIRLADLEQMAELWYSTHRTIERGSRP